MRNTMGGIEAAGSRGFLVVSFKWHKREIILSFHISLPYCALLSRFVVETVHVTTRLSVSMPSIHP